jgi:xylulokinase
MRGPFLLGIDIGTSACKTALFSRDGTVIASSTVPYPMSVPAPGLAEQDPADWFDAACRSVRACLSSGAAAPSDVAAVGVDGQSWAAVAVDKDGAVLCPSPIWLDNRAADICARLNAGIGAGRISELAGNPLTAPYTTGKIIWYRENLPGIFSKIYKVLQSNSYVVYRLTGVMTQDPSQGYGLHCFDMRRSAWDPAMASELGIPEGILPDIRPCSEVIGRVTREASALTMLPEGVPVVAGGVDSACAALGAGVLLDGETQEQGGQSGGMSICTSEFRPDPSLILCAAVTPGKYLLQGGTTGGGGVMKWICEKIAPGGADSSGGTADSSGRLTPADCDLLAAAVPAGSEGLLFLPYMSGERTPVWDPDARGVFYGIDYSKTAGHFLRAAMEGVAFSLRHNLETAAAAGCRAGVLRATGGSANSVFWTQMKADVTGLPVTVPGTDSAACLGAAMLAGVGVGVYGGFGEAVRLTSRELRRHEPDPALGDVYARGYAGYLELYRRLRGFAME